MGMLVFFPSYPLMERVLATWHADGRFAKLNAVKEVLSEPHGKDEFDEAISHYYRVIKEGAGAIMLAVFRGKVREESHSVEDE
jgi:Rad3-related DNA helicase